FQRHAQNEHAAVDAVTSPGQVCDRWRGKGDHDPDAKPKQQRHNENLAKHEDAVETFRPLRNHGYLAGIAERVRDGSASSTRAKVGRHMMGRRRMAANLLSHSHTMIISIR